MHLFSKYVFYSEDYYVDRKLKTDLGTFRVKANPSTFPVF